MAPLERLPIMIQRINSSGSSEIKTTTAATTSTICEGLASSLDLVQPLLQQQQQLTTSATKLLAGVTSQQNNNNANQVHLQSLLSPGESDWLFRKASAYTFALWTTLVTCMYMFVPQEHFEKLQGSEQNAAILAFSCLIFAFFMAVIIPLGLHRRNNGHISGILVAAMTVQIIAISTNVLLAWFPTVVIVDPITNARVFLFRWCEWTPLAGLMTYLAEAVDLPKKAPKRTSHIISALAQGLSCFGGVVLPFCVGIYDWSIVMTISFITYFMIFPRILKRIRALRAFKPRPNSVADKEHYDRLYFAFCLVFTCSIAWTILVTIYFINMFIHVYYPIGHPLRHPSIAMILDTTSDVTAKGLYMKFIADVHRLVYDPVARTRRQLGELCRLVSILWDCASDVIVISVSNGGKTTSMISPSFLKLLGEPASSVALVIETRNVDNSNKDSAVNSATFIDAYYVDADSITKGDFDSIRRLSDLVRPGLHLVTQGTKLARTTRMIGIKCGPQEQGLGECILSGTETDGIYCEISASCHDGNAVIGVARDMTERHRRAKAERQAHEMLARQKEAQSINRFTRHEVKNGLLSGIEMVDSLKRQIEKNDVTKDGHSRLLQDLGDQLQATLQTVLAETMARDVIYKEYLPRLEGCEISNLIKSSIDDNDIERFPLELNPPKMPRLHLDPQLIRYIHRNAISNAVKYGKQGGVVQTRIEYSSLKGELRIDVINEPGVGHAHLVELGEEASAGVFTQGKRLHKHLDNDTNMSVSTGDGAWIMQKCAHTLDGECSIVFEPDQTIFSVRFPVECVSEERSKDEKFSLPENTWGVAVDDSIIQRKLMGRILINAGINEKRIMVLGKDPAEAKSLSSYLSMILKESPDSQILVMMDENLDYKVKNNEREDEQVLISGSLVASNALGTLPLEQQQKILVLVRSANDSATDIELYKGRVHGFFPKAPMQKERIREILAPLWRSRFSPSRNSSS